MLSSGPLGKELSKSSRPISPFPQIQTLITLDHLHFLNMPEQSEIITSE